MINVYSFLWAKLALFGWAVVITAVLLLLSLPVLAGVKKERLLSKEVSKNTINNILHSSETSKLHESDQIEKDEEDSENSPIIPDYLHEIIIGSSLGDLHIRKRYLNSNTSLNFKGSIKHEEYILYLYSLFKSFCRT